MACVGLKTEPIALSCETVDKLIARGSGDAALLYLYLLRHGGDYSPKAAQEALGWNAARVMSAFAHLCELELARDDTPPERKNAPRPEDCPNYSTEDITSELSAEGSTFKSLLEETELLLGRKCSITETRILLELYDHLAMPPEVLLLLTARQIEETEAKYGPGRRPRMSEIKAAAYRWKKNGVDTLESAEAWLKKQDYFKSREGELLRCVGVTGREAIDGEKRFLHQWTEWGFGPEAVHMAYERTLLRTGSMKWAYCNGILRRWNDKNAHTPAEINALEGGRRKKSQTPTQSGSVAANGSQAAAARKNAEWMRRVLAEDAGEQ